MVKDIFSYSAKHDSSGLDCINCIYFIGPLEWPDIKKISSCSFHKIPLKIELLSSGYKDGEWFCKQYTDNGKTNKKSLIEFSKIYKELGENILYKATYREFDYFLEYPFQSIIKNK